MKSYLISFALLSLLLSSCGRTKTKNELKDSVLDLASPAVKLDKEVLEKNTAPVAVELAEPNSISSDEAYGNVGGGNDKGYRYTNAPHVVTDTSKKIVKDGTIAFETNNVAIARKKILLSVKKYGGYVDEDDQSTNSDENRKEYNLKIRIPAKYFDFVLDSVSASADKIDTKSISITDVTTRYIDIKTRLGNKKLLENRYLELLKKASRITDLLEIENKLTEIRSDIESTQGQLNYLNKQVSYSSLDITFYTRHVEKADKGVGIGYKFKMALVNGWIQLQNIFFTIITLWPFIVIGVAAIWLFKVWRKRRKLKQAQ
ncbi:DUF4349 domain-containing protein [Mucilaginibacter pineti]|nr:DUF4349 domain-containing protein [Mucilaginibacter pineti]